MKLPYPKTILTFGFLVILMLILISQNKDEALNPEIHAFLELSAPVAAHDGHAVFFAIEAPIDADVIELGYEIISGYKNDAEYEIADFENALDIKLIDDSSCFKDINKCFSQFKNGSRSFDGFTEAEQVLKERIDILQSYGHLKNIFEPNPADPIPSYKSLTAFQSIDFERLIQQFTNGFELESINYLYNDTKIKRELLSNSNTVINKMIYTKLLKNNIELLNEFSKHSEALKKIPELEFNEIDLSASYSYEFHINYNLINSINSSDNPVGFFNEEKTIFDPILGKLYLKENRTNNQFYTSLKFQFLHKDESIEAFLNKDFRSVYNYKHSFTNFVGNILNHVSPPDYSKYNFNVYLLACLTNQYNKNIDPQYQQSTIFTQQQCELIKNKLGEEAL